MNDQLTQADLAGITGVSLNAQQRVTKMVKVLDSAGIYYWLGYDQQICTTWHHVHNAPISTQQIPEKKVPAFMRAVPK